MKNLKNIPKFKSENEERVFWLKNDSSHFVEWKKAGSVSFPKLKPSTITISLRIPSSLLNELKTAANKRDVPYQSLIKIFLKERIDREFKESA